MRQPRVRLAQQRKAAGYTQEGLAYELGVDRTTVTRWEAGETEPQPWIRRKLARVLGVSPERLTLLLTGEDGGGSLPATWRTDQARAERAHHLAAVPALRIDGADWTPTSSQELATLLSTSTEPAATGDGTVTRLVHEWLVAEPPQLFELQAGRRIGEGLVGKIERRVAELRHMDDFVAGGDLHGLVEQELRATAGLLHEGSYPEALGRRLLASVGELCQLAGWVLGDAGVYTAATHHFSIGLKAAHAANNVALAANLVSTLAYQVSNVGNPRDAILLAQSADTGAQRQTTPRVQALLKERVAWASAKAGERRQTERALAAVETAYEHRRPADDPEWIYWLDEDEINVMAGRCYVELGKADRAVPLLSGVLDHYDERRTREVALYTSWLAEAQLMQGAIEEAVTTATTTLNLTSQISSARSDERVNVLRAKLKPYGTVPTVADFEAQARELVGQ